jgi:hypothetical protein
MLTNKQRFAYTVAEQFRNSAGWRQVKAERYQHDYRNANAARRMRELECEIEIPDDTWEEIEHLVSDRRASLAAMSETNREIGFKRNPADFAAWLERFILNLNLSEAA